MPALSASSRYVIPADSWKDKSRWPRIASGCLARQFRHHTQPLPYFAARYLFSGVETLEQFSGPIK